MSNKRKGKCLCGACQFTATLTDKKAAVCHCGMCRKWSGGMYLSTNCGSSVVFTDDSPVLSYKASEWGERLFCGKCGSSILWQMQDGTNQNASIHCFENPEEFDLVLEIFHDRKPANYSLHNETKTMTEAEVLAMLVPENASTTKENTKK